MSCKVIQFPLAAYEADAVASTADEAICVGEVQKSCMMLRTGLIAPAAEDTERELVQEHAAEPIKSMDDIIRISQYLIQNGRYRDNMLFIVGINFGLRVSDLRTLRFADLINDSFTFKDRFQILEKKTKNTRKRKRNRYVTINLAVVEAVTLYLENTPNVKLSDYMFRSQSNRGKNLNQPISRVAVDGILKGVAKDLGLEMRISTHTLRKTWAYHQMVMSGNDPRKLLLLQKMFGHSTSAQTLDYIGITSEEIDEAYRKLNLGSLDHHYLIDSKVVETDSSLA
jgi:integrase